MALSPEEKQVLEALARGWTLKSHRHLDGTKEYLLHPLEGGNPRPVTWTTVNALRAKGLIDSNKKFPAATYLLTDKGRAAAPGRGTKESPATPLTTSGWN